MKQARASSDAPHPSKAIQDTPKRLQPFADASPTSDSTKSWTLIFRLDFAIASIKEGSLADAGAAKRGAHVRCVSIAAGFEAEAASVELPLLLYQVPVSAVATPTLEEARIVPFPAGHLSKPALDAGGAVR